jgi:tetratricopeptide (TPR) repeat protein
MRICGARLEIEDEHPISWLVELLADEERRLGEMSGPRGSLDVVFNESYAALNEDEQRLYRRLGYHPGASFTATASAAALDEPVVKAAALLERLAGAQLLEVVGPRYRFHDLLRLHARNTARNEESEEERERIVRRLIRHYHRAAWIADVAISPDRLRVGAKPSDLREEELILRSAEAAFVWFEDERINLLGAIRAAVEHGCDLEASQISEFLWPCYFNRKPFPEWIEAYRLGAEAARRCGNDAAEGRLRAGLAKALMEIGELPEAERELESAEQLAEQSQHRHLYASVLEFRGHLELTRNKFAEAKDAYQGSRNLHDELGVIRGVTLQDYHLGRALAGLGDHGQAVESYTRALREIDSGTDELLMGRTLIYLAESQLKTDDADGAAHTAMQALEIMRRNGLPFYEARALEVLASLAASAGQPDDAARRLHDAHAIYSSISSPRANLELFFPDKAST